MHDNSVSDSKNYELAESVLSRFEASGVFRPSPDEYQAFVKVWQIATGLQKFNSGCAPCIEQSIRAVKKACEVYRGI